MVEESTQQNTTGHKVSFSFEHHKQSMKYTSVELFQALKAIGRAKSNSLTTDQGLRELIEGDVQRSRSIQNFLFSLLAGIAAMSFCAVVMYVSGVESIGVKLPVAIAAFIMGFVAGLAYFFYVVKSNKIMNAIN